MLSRLVIQDVVLIDKLTLTLAAGLNVFTGETGAGKSILLDALGLALGERSDASLIRAGATQANVTAEFDGPLPPSLAALMEENGLTFDNPLILRRTIAKDGRSRAFINDQPVGIALMRQVGEGLLEIHGQFETHGLLNPATHRHLLDAFAGLAPLKQKVAEFYDTWQKARVDFETASKALERARNEEAFLRAAVAELDELAPASDEIETLAARRRSLQHREKILEALQTAENALEGDKGAVAALAQAGKAIARVADKAAGLAELLATLDRVAEDVGEAAQELTRFARAIDAEPESLDRIEERLFALRAVARKHNVAPESLGALQQDLKKRLELLEDQGDRLTALAKAVETTQHAYKKRAEELSAKRRKAADELAKAIQRELPPLKLERARFVAEVAASPEEQWSREGMDRIAFLASTNPGATPGALQKVASGGELARFMLALKVVLAASDPIPTLVFDEVDTGIGGATASAVGERLARLAADVQILVVTHSPQVAARGSMHIRVAKQIQAQKARTATEILDETARVEEIARMLAGTETTDAARQAARSLLRDAPPSEKKKTKRASSGNLRG